jgi:hypothetical protein
LTTTAYKSKDAFIIIARFCSEKYKIWVLVKPMDRKTQEFGKLKKCFALALVRAED